MNEHDQKGIFKAMQIQEREYAELLKISKVRTIANGNFYIPKARSQQNLLFC